MIKPVLEEYLYVYYDVCRTFVSATPEKIRVLLQVPLASSDRVLEHYDVAVFPIRPKSTNNTWVQWDIEDHSRLLISRDRTHYAQLPQLNKASCRFGTIPICYDDIPLHAVAEPNCLTALFLQMPKHPNCNRITYPLFHPYFRRLGQDWIFAVPETMYLELHCPSYIRLTLNGSGIIRESAHCEGYSKHIRLLAQNQGVIGLNQSQRFKVESQFPELSIGLLKPGDAPPSMDLTDVIARLNRSILDRKDYDSSWDIHQVHRMHNSSWITSTTALVVATITTLALIAVVYLGWKHYQKLHRKSSPGFPLTVLTPNEQEPPQN